MGQYIDTDMWFPIINGTFDADTDWQHGLSWIIADGVADGVGPLGPLRQVPPFWKGYAYRLEFDIISFNPPNPPFEQGLLVAWWLAGEFHYETIGHKTINFTNAKDPVNTGLQFWVAAGIASCKIDNVVITQLGSQVGVNYGFVPIKGTLTENWHYAPTKSQINFANLNGASSCLMLFNPQTSQT